MESYLFSMLKNKNNNYVTIISINKCIYIYIYICINTNYILCVWGCNYLQLHGCDL